MQIRIRTLVLIILAALVAGSGVTGGALYAFQSRSVPVQTVADTAAPPSDLAKLMKVYTSLSKDYFEPLDQEKLIDGAIDGMLRSLEDPYSTYMSVTETSAFMENISASFEGIGVEIREENDHIVVVSPIKGTPGDRAGLRPNDILLEVNGHNLVGLKSSEAVTFLRGPKGTEARLRVRRAGLETPLEVTVIRDKIPVYTVIAEMKDDKIGHIQITRVSETTYDEFKRSWDDLKAQGARGIVLDLRQNPGGLLSVAVKLSEHFVPNGELLLQVKYGDGQVEQYRSQGKRSNLPTVVLIDGGSASAAEIIAGALNESANIPLIGETSFGKGTVQTTEELDDGSSIKYTIAQWLTPKGNHIHKQGIKPQVTVALPDYANLPYPMIDRAYKVGEQAPQIKTIQQMLKVLDYEPGRADGLLAETTAEALRQFQADQGLEQTGTLTKVTADQLVRLLQQKLAANDTQFAKAKEVLQGLIK